MVTCDGYHQRGTRVVQLAIVCALIFLLSAVGSVGTSAAKSYRPIPAGWKMLDVARGDVYPGGGIETVLLLGRRCQGLRKCFSYEIVVTQGSQRRKVAQIVSSIDEPISVGTSSGNVRISGYETDVGYFEIWSYEGGAYKLVEAGGTS